MSTLQSSATRRSLRYFAALAISPLLLVGALAITPAQATSLNVSFSVTNADFGSVTVGTTGTSSVVVTNTSDFPLYFKGANVHGGANGDFSESAGACAGSLGIGDSCDISVNFTPTAPGTRATSLGVTLGAKNPAGNFIAQATEQSSLTGVGVAPSASLSDGDAGSIDVGSTGIATATLTNTSSTGLSIDHGSLQGVVNKDFSYDSTTCPAVLGSEQSCVIVIEFKPSVAGSVSATLNLTLGVSGTSDKTFMVQSTISGTGVRSGGRATIVSLTSLDFGSVTVGTSASGSVAITNTSAHSVSVSHFGIGGNAEKEFALGSNNCPATLASGDTCNVDITFTPGYAKLRNATLAVRVQWAVNSNIHTATVLASLSGTGVKPTVTLTAPDFGSVALGSSTTDQVVANNTSLAAVTFKSAKITGPHQPSWKVSSTTCAGALASGASCEIELTFTPHSLGDLSTVLSTVFTITTTNGHVTHTVLVNSAATVHATGSLPTFSVSAPPLGPTAQNTKVSESATITNTSGVALSYSGSHIAGVNAKDFTVANATCTAQIAANGGTCTLTLSFDPTGSVSGTIPAFLDVTLNVDGITPAHSVSLATAISGTES